MNRLRHYRPPIDPESRAGRKLSHDSQTGSKNPLLGNSPVWLAGGIPGENSPSRQRRARDAKGVYRQESPADTVGEHRGEAQGLFKLSLLASWTASF